MRMDSRRATGAKVSPKSKPSTWVKPCATNLALFPYYLSIFILFVLENTLCSNDIMKFLGSFYKAPHFVVCEVVEFFMHGIYPIRIIKCIFHLKGFNTRDKRVMSKKVCQTSTSSYPLFDASIDVLGEVLKMF